MTVRENRWHILFALLIGVIMGPLDASIVNINLPVIADFFSVPPSRVAWVSISYLLMLSTLLLPFGRLGDILGFKKLYLRGLLLFVFMSLCCGLSPSFPMLVISRGLQAIGAGITMSLATAIITAVFPSEERGRALGFNALAVALGLAIGPSLGGFLGDLFSWRSIFLVNLPLGLIAYFLCRRLLPEEAARKREEFDLLGAFLSFISLLLLLLFISEGTKAGWNVPLSLLLIGIAFSLFVYQERRVQKPMLDLSLFKNPIFSLALSSAFLNFLTQYVLIFSLPFYLQRVLLYSASRAGGIMTAFPLTVLLVAPFAGWLSDKIGHKLPSLLGLFLCTLSAFLISRLTPAASGFDVAWRLSLYGLGTGIFQSPNNSAVMGSVGREKLGIAGAILATIRNAGMVFGLSSASAVLSWRLNIYSTLKLGNALFLSLKDTCFFAGLVSSLSVLLALATFFVRKK